VTSDVFSDSDSLDGLAFTVDRVEEDGSIIFTNTRKTSTVTVRKIFDPEEDSVSVPFAATVLNGATAIPGYTVYGTAGDEGTLTTDATGTVTFDLEHAGMQSLTVPYGARLVISEDIKDYTAEISTVNGASDLDNIENSFTMNVAGEETVTFTNRVNGVNVILKKIGVSSETQEVVSDHLGGAEFTIYIDSDRTTVATGKIDLDGTTTSIQLKNLISSDDDGIFFAGTLDIGTYYLHEVKAPAGYIAPAEDLRMTVASDGSIVLYAQTSNTSNEFSVVDGVCSVNVKNSRGFALPSTGGRGRSHFYILGIMLIGMAGAAFFIKRKCRMASH
jgi:LPXTG-motif cell wall-anchored protein